MTIKQLKLKNCRVFEDNVIVFDKGINFLLGKRGCGFTSAINAIRWCMDIEYDKLYAKNCDLFLNNNAFKSLREYKNKTQTMSASLTFALNDDEIKVIKTNVYEYVGGVNLKDKTTKIFVNGIRKELDKNENENFIQEIINPKLPEFLFINEEKTVKQHFNEISRLFENNQDFIDNFNSYTKKFGLKNKYGHILKMNEKLEPFWLAEHNCFGYTEQLLLFVMSKVVCINLLQNKLKKNYFPPIFFDGIFEKLCHETQDAFLSFLKEHAKQVIITFPQHQSHLANSFKEINIVNL